MATIDHTETKPPLALPHGYELVRVLVDNDAGAVVHARRSGDEVALRLERGPGAARIDSGELEVLAAVTHPDLATLVDHGSLPTGGRFVARTWIEGTDLADWAREGERDPSEIGAVIARVCPALQHLHLRGFVHADLKPENIIVRSGGDPVLTDFGLAKKSRESAELGGTLFAIAPECLLGHEPDPRADLFALGVMLHRLIAHDATRERSVSARDFYGRFPREDYFAASGASPDELPTWCRDVVCQLLAHDPDQRPASATEVGRTLAARLGLSESELGLDSSGEVLRWPVGQGRGLGQIASELTESGSYWIRLPDGEEPAPLARELAVHMALAGQLPGNVELSREVSALETAVALDHWAEALDRDSSASHWLVVVGTARAGGSTGSDRWHGRAVEALASAQGASEEARRVVAVAAHEPPADSGVEWKTIPLAPVGLEAIESFLAERMTGESVERRSQLARWLLAASQGTASGAQSALDWLQRGEWIVASGDGHRLRPGSLPHELVGASAADRSALAGDAAELLGALRLLGGRAPSHVLRELAPRDAGDADALIGELVAAGHVVQRNASTGPELMQSGLGAGNEELTEGSWRAVCTRWAAWLDRDAAPAHRIAAARFLAAPTDADALAALLAASRELRERGLAELSLELCELVLGIPVGAAPGARDAVELELAESWCALGAPDRALRIVEDLTSRADSPSARLLAAMERVRGRVLFIRNDNAAALEHYQRAAALDESDGGESLLGRAQLLYQLGRDDELCELAESSVQSETDLRARARSQAVAYWAMALMRRGDIASARSLLEGQLADAMQQKDATREAGLRISLGTLERRSGNRAIAIEHFERAVEQSEKDGILTHLAQARAQFASLLGESGRLQQADALMRSAVALRERLGDRTGAQAARGMLGMILCDRGLLAPAIETLQRAHRDLLAADRSVDARLIGARLEEARARIGRGNAGKGLEERLSAASGEARTLTALARVCALLGRRNDASRIAAGAASTARERKLSVAAAEASALLARLDGRAPEMEPSREDSPPLLRQDVELFELLQQVPWDAAVETRARKLADELLSVGRDDRAARLYWALAARAAERDVRAEARGLANKPWRACSTGLTEAESKELKSTLLGLPDPWPSDLRAAEHDPGPLEESDADVVMLLEINRRLLAQDDLRKLLGAIVEHALSVTGAQRGFLVLEEDGEMHIDTALDSRRGGLGEPEIELSGSVLRDALKKMSTLRISNAIDDPLLANAPSVKALELRSVLCTPFEIDEKLRGVVYVDHLVHENVFDERCERLLELLTNQAALAILQVRRLEQIRSLNERLNNRIVHVESDLKSAHKALREVGVPTPAGGLVGTSPAMQEVHRVIERAAPTKLAVLIVGESGSGKELAARALHDLSPRREGRFISENCAALPATLIEGELFGAKRGAFTGAEQDREGLFQRAHGGTLFLDEIGELPIELQAKLLRVLETSRVRRLGDNEEIEVDFRLVAATNRDLNVEVAEGRFRADLFYRLDTLRVALPPLAARIHDIPELIDHYLRRQAGPGEDPREVAPAVVAKLCRRPWPGNVRELFNELARLCVMSDGVIDDPDLVRSPQRLSEGAGLRSLAELERDAIERALEATAGDKRLAAEILGISRAKIYQRLKEWSDAGPKGA